MKMVILVMYQEKQNCPVDEDCYLSEDWPTQCPDVNINKTLWRGLNTQCVVKVLRASV